MIPSDNPPSTTNIAPVVHSLRVKYSAASAISSSVPIRPNAWAGASDSSLFLDSAIITIVLDIFDTFLMNFCKTFQV